MGREVARGRLEDWRRKKGLLFAFCLLAVPESVTLASVHSPWQKQFFPLARVESICNFPNTCTINFNVSPQIPAPAQPPTLTYMLYAGKITGMVSEVWLTYKGSNEEGQKWTPRVTVKGDPRTIAVHQTGGWLELTASVADLPSCIHVLCRVTFQILPSRLESISVPLVSGLTLWFVWPVKCNGSHGEPVPILASRGLGYFLSVSWILIPTVRSRLTQWSIRDREACHPIASCPPLTGRAAINCKCLRESSSAWRNIQQSSAPNASLLNCELHKWSLLLIPKF